MSLFFRFWLTNVSSRWESFLLSWRVKASPLQGAMLLNDMIGSQCWHDRLFFFLNEASGSTRKLSRTELKLSVSLREFQIPPGLNSSFHNLHLTCSRGSRFLLLSSRSFSVWSINNYPLLHASVLFYILFSFFFFTDEWYFYCARVSSQDELTQLLFYL